MICSKFKLFQSNSVHLTDFFTNRCYLVIFAYMIFSKFKSAISERWSGVSSMIVPKPTFGFKQLNSIVWTSRCLSCKKRPIQSFFVFYFPIYLRTTYPGFHFLVLAEKGVAMFLIASGMHFLVDHFPQVFLNLRLTICYLPLDLRFHHMHHCNHHLMSHQFSSLDLDLALSRLIMVGLIPFTMQAILLQTDFLISWQIGNCFSRYAEQTPLQEHFVLHLKNRSFCLFLFCIFCYFCFFFSFFSFSMVSTLLNISWASINPLLLYFLFFVSPLALQCLKWLSYWCISPKIAPLLQAEERI